MKKFWNFGTVKNEESGTEERVLELYGTIADETWFGDEVTPAMFKSELDSGSGPITVYINSPGGDCIAASQIYTMLKEYKNTVTVKIDGLAASAASVIAMAGDKVIMAPTSLIMIHNPSMIAMGERKDFEKAIDILNEVKESIINAYQSKTGLSRAVISHMMDDESWMNANKAIELKFADEILKGTTSNIVSDSLLFSAKKVEMSLFNKIAKQEEAPTSIKTGRSVSTLKNELIHVKKFI